jgi:hypothetical protein
MAGGGEGKFECWLTHPQFSRKQTRIAPKLQYFTDFVVVNLYDLLHKLCGFVLLQQSSIRLLQTGFSSISGRCRTKKTLMRLCRLPFIKLCGMCGYVGLVIKVGLGKG